MTNENKNKIDYLVANQAEVERKTKEIISRSKSASFPKMSALKRIKEEITQDIYMAEAIYELYK